jgi:hypothetical protein
MSLDWLISASLAEAALPLRLHERGVEPDSQLGAPRLAAAFERYLGSNPCSTVPSDKPCYHREPPNGCRHCGDGGYVLRYRRPVKCSLKQLVGRRPLIQDGKLDARLGSSRHYALTIFTLRAAGYDVQQTCELLGVDRAYVEEAIAALRRRTRALARVKDRSEAQLNAEAAA